MNQFRLLQEQSKELGMFPHICEFALDKNSTIKLNSFTTSVSDTLRIYGIVDGKFDWLIGNKQHTLYPEDLVLVLPGQEIGGVRGFLGIGTIFRLYMNVLEIVPDAGLTLGNWSRLSGTESLAIRKILAANGVSIVKKSDAIQLLYDLHAEIKKQEIGYVPRVNSFIDSLLIIFARQSIYQVDADRDFSITFLNLEEKLRRNLSHQWTVEEMADLFGLGTTAFTDKVRKHTGFSPLNYLINIRISESIKMLKRKGVNLTDIALQTGFYSSQHFSTTFRKLTGFTPGEFRRNMRHVR